MLGDLLLVIPSLLRGELKMGLEMVGNLCRIYSRSADQNAMTKVKCKIIVANNLGSGKSQGESNKRGPSQIQSDRAALRNSS